MEKNISVLCACRSLARLVGVSVLTLGLLVGCNDDDDPTPLNYAETIADGRVAVRQALVDTDTPSASVALIDGERVVWSETFGYIDKATQTAPSSTTLYGIGSISKVFAAEFAPQRLGILPGKGGQHGANEHIAGGVVWLMGAPGAGAGRGDVIGSDLEVVRADPNGLGLRGNPLTRRDSSRNHSGHR